MPSDDRDRQLDQALARHLRRSSPDGCPDAEILAGYHEGTLGPDELLAFNQHFANCKMCQETLAILAESGGVNTETEEWKEPEIPAFGRTIPAAPPAPMIAAATPASEARGVIASAMAPPPQQQKPRPRALRYLIPIGALAAVALGWVSLREHNSTQVAQVREQKEELRQLNKIQPVPEPSAPSVALSGNAPASGPLADKKANPDVSLDKDLAVRRRADEEQLREQSRIAQILAQRELTSNLRITPGERSAARGAAAAPAPSGSDNGAAASQSSSAADATTSPATPSAAAKAAAGAAPQLAQPTPVQSYLRDAAAKNLNVILSPDSTQVWIVRNAGGIMHGSGDGENWNRQNSGVASDLIAGSAASSSIVWIVGKSGTILLTTDGGANWKKTASPVSGDLAGVQATDAKRAKIWDSVNHQYATADGGATWTPVTN